MLRCQTMPPLPEKVLFLDFDGVLNTYATRSMFGFERLDPDKVELVNRIVEETGCAVVVSSAWRTDGKDFVQRCLTNVGFKGEVYGVTPYLRGHEPRRNEITKWMKENNFYGDFAIVDDMQEAEIRGHFVQTRDTEGLQVFHLIFLVAMLGAQNPKCDDCKGRGWIVGECHPEETCGGCGGMGRVKR